jgi:hypothetical protein
MSNDCPFDREGREETQSVSGIFADSMLQTSTGPVAACNVNPSCSWSAVVNDGLERSCVSPTQLQAVLVPRPPATLAGPRRSCTERGRETSNGLDREEREGPTVNSGTKSRMKAAPIAWFPSSSRRAEAGAGRSRYRVTDDAVAVYTKSPRVLPSLSAAFAAA